MKNSHERHISAVGKEQNCYLIKLKYELAVFRLRVWNLLECLRSHLSVLLQGILEFHALSIPIEIIFENYTKQQSLFGASKYL